MIPFCRTLEEAEQVVALLASQGLVCNQNGLRLITMCEIPSNALLTEEFLQYYDGFSIGSNDIPQLTLGIDRDSSLVSHVFDERNSAVKKLLKMAIDACQKQDKYIGICGQGPSDYPDFAIWLSEQGISSLSLNPDSVTETWLHLATIKNNDQAKAHGFLFCARCLEMVEALEPLKATEPYSLLPNPVPRLLSRTAVPRLPYTECILSLHCTTYHVITEVLCLFVRKSGSRTRSSAPHIRSQLVSSLPGMPAGYDVPQHLS